MYPTNDTLDNQECVGSTKKTWNRAIPRSEDLVKKSQRDWGRWWRTPGWTDLQQIFQRWEGTSGFLEWRRCEGERGRRVGVGGWKVKLRRRKEGRGREIRGSWSVRTQKTGSTGSKTGSTGFWSNRAVKARRKRYWLREISGSLTAQTANLTAQTAAQTDGADAEEVKTGSTGFYTGSTGFHQGKTGWVAYSAGLLNQFPDITRKGYNST
jgi:hypothetical protein